MQDHDILDAIVRMLLHQMAYIRRLTEDGRMQLVNELVLLFLLLLHHLPTLTLHRNLALRLDSGSNESTDEQDQD